MNSNNKSNSSWNVPELNRHFLESKPEEQGNPKIIDSALIPSAPFDEIKTDEKKDETKTVEEQPVATN